MKIFATIIVSCVLMIGSTAQAQECRNGTCNLKSAAVTVIKTPVVVIQKAAAPVKQALPSITTRFRLFRWFK